MRTGSRPGTKLFLTATGLAAVLEMSLLHAPAVFAQASGSSWMTTTSNTSAARSGEHESITVTARYTRENMQNTPAATTAITPDKLFMPVSGVSKRQDGYVDQRDSRTQRRGDVRDGARRVMKYADLADDTFGAAYRSQVQTSGTVPGSTP